MRRASVLCAASTADGQGGTSFNRALNTSEALGSSHPSYEDHSVNLIRVVGTLSHLFLIDVTALVFSGSVACQWRGRI